MRLQLTHSRFALFAAILLAMSPLALLADDGDKPAKEPAAKAPAADDEAVAEEEPEEELSPGEVILKEINEVAQKPPRSKEEFIEQLKKVREISRRAMAAEEAGSEIYMRAESINAQLSARLMGMLPEDELKVELKAFLEKVTKKEKLSRTDIGIMMSVTRGVSDELAAELNKKFAGIARKAGEDEVAVRFEGAARRAQLLGNEMKINEVTFEGEKFDITDLKGKVVLVDFWATWCGPCLAEYPNIKKNYEKYHDAGFEVVGISLDQDRDALSEYLEKKELPWITLHNGDKPGDSPTADYYGISGIPTMILIGKDGKVISLRARGEELSSLLADQFGSGEDASDTPKEDAPEKTPEPDSIDN
ncbi:MAG: TlpA family protein disulfide reductase [bacterium]|nr:TlpA family protein disulfide reductase [bacterium]